MSLTVATEESFKHTIRQMGKLRDQLQKGYYGFCPSETWTPNVNLYETDKTYVVCVDLAGVDKEKIEVVVHDGLLTLKGNRPVPGPEEFTAPQSKRVRIHLMEIDHGAFSREVELPKDVAPQGITATHRNGMLWIELPKKV